MAIRVSGGGGYIGSVFVRRLLDRDHEVRLLHRRGEGPRQSP